MRAARCVRFRSAPRRPAQDESAAQGDARRGAPRALGELKIRSSSQTLSKLRSRVSTYTARRSEARGSSFGVSDAAADA